MVCETIQDPADALSTSCRDCLIGYYVDVLLLFLLQRSIVSKVMADS